LNRPSIAQIVKYAEEAERLGFDSIFTADTPFLRVSGSFLETFTVLSAVASVTKKITLGTAVLLLPLRDPIYTAKASASLDLLTNGRVVLGVGGGIFRGEFTSLGVDYQKRWDRTEEAINVIRKLWSAEKVSHTGTYYKFQNARIGPPPARGTIPILIGGAMEHVLERTAKVADGWIASSHNNDAKGLKESWKRIREYAKKYGRDPDKLMFMHNVFTHVSASFEDSLKETRSFFQQLYGGSIPQELKSRTILGSPEDCIDSVSERVDAGIQHIIFMFPFNSLEKLRRFGRQVLPKLKKKF
jgi:probable F420-dependent oxidoreductase